MGCKGLGKPVAGVDSIAAATPTVWTARYVFTAFPFCSALLFCCTGLKREVPRLGAGLLRRKGGSQ
jgi:hypothetical protein